MLGLFLHDASNGLRAGGAGSEQVAMKGKAKLFLFGCPGIIIFPSKEKDTIIYSSVSFSFVPALRNVISFIPGLRGSG